MIHEKINNIKYETIEGATPTQNIINQLKVLIETPIGTVFLDRDFGMDFSPLDKPLPIAINLYASLLADKIDAYIPSIKLSKINIDFSKKEIQKLNIKVVIEYV